MKKKITAGLVVAAAAVLICAVVFSNRGSSMFSVENKEDGTVSVTAQAAGEGSGGIGYVTLKDGQTLNVRANLTDNSAIRVEVLPASATDVLRDETFTAVDFSAFALPAGDYVVRVTAQKGATGSMTIAPED